MMMMMHDDVTIVSFDFILVFLAALHERGLKIYLSLEEEAL